MFIKTLLDGEAVAHMKSDPGLGRSLTNSMRYRAVLLLNKDQKDYLKKNLPTTAWKKLEEDMVKGRIRKRDWSGDVEQLRQGPAPEVIVGDGINPRKGPGDRTTPGDYEDSPFVARRLELINRERDVRDREEFWEELLRPAIEAFPANMATIEIVDQYVFQDFRRQRKSSSGKKGSKPTDTGLGWMLDRLDRLAAEHGHTLRVSIITAEKPRHLVKHAKDDMNREIIVDLLTTLLQSVPCHHLDLTVLVAPRKLAEKTPPGLHDRRIIIKGTCGFRLDKGAGDFYVHDDRSSTTWTWFNRWSNDQNRHHQNLKSKIPGEFSLPVE